jgi:hypothetical protein
VIIDRFHHTIDDRGDLVETSLERHRRFYTLVLCTLDLPRLISGVLSDSVSGVLSDIAPHRCYPHDPSSLTRLFLAAGDTPAFRRQPITVAVTAQASAVYPASVS